MALFAQASFPAMVQQDHGTSMSRLTLGDLGTEIPRTPTKSPAATFRDGSTWVGRRGREGAGGRCGLRATRGRLLRAAGRSGLHASLTRALEAGETVCVVSQKSLVCPISLDLFEDPVIAADGHTYSRRGIERWFSDGYKTSPMTNEPLANLGLRPNLIVRSLINGSVVVGGGEQGGGQLVGEKRKHLDSAAVIEAVKSLHEGEKGALAKAEAALSDTERQLSWMVDRALAANPQYPQNIARRTEMIYELLFRAINLGQAAVVDAIIESNRRLQHIPDFSLERLDDSTGFRPLHEAVFKGHLKVARVLLKHGADVNGKTQESFGALSDKTALIMAARLDHPRPRRDMVELLLDGGASIDMQDVYGRRALALASNRGHEDVVEMLLERGASIDARSKTGKTALMLASQGGHAGVVGRLLGKGASPDLQPEDGKTALMWASMNGHRGVVEVLLDKGVNLELRGMYQRTALMHASAFGHSNIVELLVRKGAIVDAGDEAGWTALMFASRKGSEGVIKVLLQNGADVNMFASDGATALMDASGRGNMQVVELLVRAGARLDDQDREGRSALMRARAEEVVGFLVEKGASIDARSKTGKTALMLVCECDLPSKKAAEVLVEKGASIDLQDEKGWTALISASASGCLELVEFLVGAGANIDLRDAEGSTAREVASKKGHVAVAEKLQRYGT